MPVGFTGYSVPRNYRKERSMRKNGDERRRVVSAVQDAGFPGYDRTLHSKCLKPEHYGIMRVPEAEEAVQSLLAEKASKAKEKPSHANITAEAAVRARKDGHKFKRRISCRLPENEYRAVHKSFKASSDKTMQDYLRRVLKEHLEKEKCRLDVAASKAAGD